MHSPYDSYWSNDYLASLNDLHRMQQFKPLVIDDELRTLAANVRERLSALGNHNVVPMHLLALQLLESGLFYEDTDTIRTRLKTELRDAVESLDDLLSKEGTQRERVLLKLDQPGWSLRTFGGGLAMNTSVQSANLNVRSDDKNRPTIATIRLTLFQSHFCIEFHHDEPSEI